MVDIKGCGGIFSHGMTGATVDLVATLRDTNASRAADMITIKHPHCIVWTIPWHKPQLKAMRLWPEGVCGGGCFYCNCTNTV